MTTKNDLHGTLFEIALKVSQALDYINLQQKIVYLFYLYLLLCYFSYLFCLGL